MKSFNEWMKERITIEQQYAGRTVKDNINRQVSIIMSAYSSLSQFDGFLTSHDSIENQPIKNFHREAILKVMNSLLDEMKKVDNVSTGANAATGGTISMLSQDGPNSKVEQYGRIFNYVYNYFKNLNSKFQDKSLTGRMARTLILDAKEELMGTYIRIKQDKDSGKLDSYADEVDPPSHLYNY